MLHFIKDSDDSFAVFSVHMCILAAHILDAFQQDFPSVFVLLTSDFFKKLFLDEAQKILWFGNFSNLFTLWQAITFWVFWVTFGEISFSFVFVFFLCLILFLIFLNRIFHFSGP